MPTYEDSRKSETLLLVLNSSTNWILVNILFSMLCTFFHPVFQIFENRKNLSLSLNPIVIGKFLSTTSENISEFEVIRKKD